MDDSVVDMADMPAREVFTEVDLTPTMIKAGALELSAYHHDFETLEDGAIRIWLAMLEAGRQEFVT